MDYEKEYKSLVAKVKKAHQFAQTDSTKSVLEDILPQLRESEDERIRKWLADYFSSIKATVWIHRDITCEQILDWLEKQKDASYAIEAVERIDKYIDEHVANAHDMKDSNPEKKYYRGWDDALGEMAGILQDVYSDEKQKEPTTEELYEEAGTTEKEYIANTMKMVRAMRERKKEQKPEDKEITLTNFEEVLNTFLFDFANSPIEDCEPKEYTKKHSAEILKAAYAELNAQLKQDIFEAQQEGRREGYEAAKAEQKPAEWSEEDERIVRFYEDDYDNNLGDMPMCDVIENRIKFKDWLINRLKTIRPQSQLKPSEVVEGLFWHSPFPTICLDDCRDYNFKDNQKVRVIIVEEESK